MPAFERRERASGEEKVQLAERGRLEAEQRALKEELDRRKLEKLELVAFTKVFLQKRGETEIFETKLMSYRDKI